MKLSVIALLVVLAQSEDLPCKRVTKEEFQDNFHNFKRDQLSLIDLRSDNYEKHISQHLPLKVAAELKFLTFYDKSKPFPTMKYKANQWKWADNGIVEAGDFYNQTMEEDIANEAVYMYTHQTLCAGWKPQLYPVGWKLTHDSPTPEGIERTDLKTLVPLRCDQPSINACDVTSFGCEKLCLN